MITSISLQTFVKGIYTNRHYRYIDSSRHCHAWQHEDLRKVDV